MAILYYQQLEKNKIIFNFHSKIGRRILQNDDILELREVLDHIIDKDDAKTDTLKLFKQKNVLFFYVFSKQEMMYAFIGDSEIDEENLTDLVITISEAETSRIESLLNKFNENNFDEIHSELLKARDACKNSLNLILNRGQKIDKINLLSEQLNLKTKKFRENTDKLFNKKIIDGFLVVFFVVFVFFIYFMFLR